MNIQATCDTCGRTFLLSQIGEDSDAPGRCPFCGAHFAKHYSTLLVSAVRDAEAAAAEFAHALRRLEDLNTGFRLDVDGLLRSLAEQVGRGESSRAAT